MPARSAAPLPLTHPYPSLVHPPPRPTSLRVVIRHLAKPIVGATLNALADLLGGADEAKRDVAALAILAISADGRPGGGRGARADVDGALVEVLLPRMIGIADKKVRERREEEAGARGGREGRGRERAQTDRPLNPPPPPFSVPRLRTPSNR
jgi:hypothetical protein